MKFIIILIGLSLFQGFITEYEYVETKYICETFEDCEFDCLPHYEQKEDADDYCMYKDCYKHISGFDICNITCSNTFYARNMSWKVEPCKELKQTDVEVENDK